MVGFHDHLATRPPHEALRTVQRAMRDQGDATPAAWAGFVHLGW